MVSPLKLCFCFSVSAILVAFLIMGFFPKQDIAALHLLGFGLGMMSYAIFMGLWELFLRIKKLERQDNGNQQTRSG